MLPVVNTITGLIARHLHTYSEVTKVWDGAEAGGEVLAVVGRHLFSTLPPECWPSTLACSPGGLSNREIPQAPSVWT